MVVMIVTAVILAGLVSLIVIETSKKNKEGFFHFFFYEQFTTLLSCFVLNRSILDPFKLEPCVSSHETYSDVTFYDLKKYKQYAVAADDEHCSRVGK